jgi:hypothetical protein
MDIDFALDGGAYTTLSPVVLSRGVIHAPGPYACADARVRGRAVATNHPPNGAFRGFGAPQSIFAIEQAMDGLARELGITECHGELSPAEKAALLSGWKNEGCRINMTLSQMRVALVTAMKQW